MQLLTDEYFGEDGDLLIPGQLQHCIQFFADIRHTPIQVMKAGNRIYADSVNEYALLKINSETWEFIRTGDRWFINIIIDESIQGGSAVWDEWDKYYFVGIMDDCPQILYPGMHFHEFTRKKHSSLDPFTRTIYGNDYMFRREMKYTEVEQVESFLIKHGFSTRADRVTNMKKMIDGQMEYSFDLIK